MLCAAVCAGQETAYQVRLRALIYAKTWPVGNGLSDPDAGKRDWPGLLAEMWKVRDDPTALQRLIDGHGDRLLASKWAGSFYKPFSVPGLTLYYSQYKDRLPASQVERIRSMVRDRGWEFLTRPDHHMDPIYPFTEFNSENFNWMARLGGVFWAQELADAERQQYFGDYLDDLVRALYGAGRVEWNSHVYWGYTFQAALVLYESTHEAKTKAQARAILDWMVFEAALHNLDLQQVGPDVRAKEGAYKAYNGSVWRYAYLYFGQPADLSRAGVQEAGYAPYSSYRPPQAAVDIAVRAYRTPVEIWSAKPHYSLDRENYHDWSNVPRYEFETLYLDRDFTLGSVATLRPNGAADDHGQHPFSEESVWQLGVRGLGRIFGNAGANNTMAGRSPYEEVAQFGGILARAIRGTDRVWVAIPRSVDVQMEGDRAFARLPHDVWIQFTALRATGLRAADWSDRDYRQYVWTFDPKQLGGLVMEVGTGEQRDGTLRSEGADAFVYRSANGHELKLAYQPTTTYRLSSGVVVEPAGVLPRVWRDGQTDDFDTWDAYRVVAGEDILAQKWGGNSLRARSYQVTIDRETATPTWTAKP